MRSHFVVLLLAAPLSACGAVSELPVRGDATDSGVDADASPTPVCAVDGDCRVANDCCTCASLGAGESAPACPGECKAAACTLAGVASPRPRCVAGACVLDVDCTAAHALCKSMPPACGPGKVNTVANACWRGCVDARECPSAP